MRTVTPIQVAEIPLVEANYLRGTVQQIWEDMAVLLGSSLLIGLCALPAILLVWWTRNSLFWVIADFTVVPAWVACCYLAGRTSVNRKPYLADFFAALIRYYWQSCLLGLPTAILLVIVLVSFPVLAGGTSLLLAVGVVFQIIGLFIVLAIFIFAAPILGNFQVKVQQACLYALALLLRSPMVALGLLAMAFLLVTAANALGLGIWLIIPMIFIPFEVNATLMLIKKTTELERINCPAKSTHPSVQ